MWDYYSCLALGLSVPIVTLASFYLGKSARHFDEEVDLTGKTVLITNPDTELGKALGLGFAKRNARVILACRSMIDGGLVRLDIVANSGQNDRNVLTRILNIDSVEGVRDFAQMINLYEERLDIIVLNPADVEFPPSKSNADTLKFFQENVFGPFLLTTLLLDLMKKSGPDCRILNIGPHGVGNFFDDLNILDDEKYLSYDALWNRILMVRSRSRLYSNLRAMKTIFTLELASRVRSDGIMVNCIDPGQNPGASRDAVLHCALSRKLKNSTAKFFRGWNESNPQELVFDREKTQRVWKFCECLTGITPTFSTDSTL